MEFYAVLLLVLVVQIEGQRVAEVSFNSRGVTGYIRFSEVDNGVRIQANLQGLRGNHVWHVHDLPVDQTADPAVQCQGVNVGGHYDPQGRNDGSGYAARCAANQEDCEVGDLVGKFGPLMPNTPFDMVDTTNLTLRGPLSIIGRSVVIHSHMDSANDFECGTIRSQAELNGAMVTLLQSSLINPIAGTVYFKQVADEDVQIWGKVYWINDSPQTVEHNWHIHQLAPGEEYRAGVCDITPTGNIRGHYDPFGSGPTDDPDYRTNCEPDRTSGCEVGDLTGKHARVIVSATPSPYSDNAFFYTDNFLNLTGTYTVNNRSLAIHVPNAGGPVQSCAPLVMSENIVLTQYGVGDITLSQSGPFEDTLLTSTNSRTDTTLEGSALNSLIQNCSTTAAFSPYNPVASRSDGVETPDRYNLGAFQTRYDELSGSTTRRLFDVPIYGADVSITSLNLRTVNSGGSTCSALIPSLTDSNVIIAKASFSRVLRGAVYLIQRDNGFGQLGNTHIIVDLYYNDANTPATTGHNWHVHMNPTPSSDMMCSPTVGGHYNPFNVSLGNMPDSTNSNYGTDCSPRYQLRCESGDLAGKHGRLDISPDSSTRPTYTYVDSDVPLAGTYTIVGRSIAIHDVIEGAPIFDCGTVRQLYPSQSVTIRVNPSTELRTELTTALAGAVDNLDATDILILQQNVVSIGFSFNCVDVSVRVLGPTTETANTYANRVRDAGASMFSCNGATSTTMQTSASRTLQTTLVLPLLVAAITMLTKH